MKSGGQISCLQTKSQKCLNRALVILLFWPAQRSLAVNKISGSWKLENQNVLQRNYWAAGTSIVASNPRRPEPFIPAGFKFKFCVSAVRRGAGDRREPRQCTTLKSTALTELTAHIVSAYISKNSVAVTDLQTLIATVHGALQAIQTGAPVPLDLPEQKPAVSIKKSVTPDYLISLEDGARYKSLKRHLATKYGLTPQAYREKWGLPPSYPMVAPNYAAARSAMAKSSGLGQKQKEAPTKRGKKAKAGDSANG